MRKEKSQALGTRSAEAWTDGAERGLGWLGSDPGPWDPGTPEQEIDRGAVSTLLGGAGALPAGPLCLRLSAAWNPTDSHTRARWRPRGSLPRPPRLGHSLLHRDLRDREAGLGGRGGARTTRESRRGVEPGARL